MLSVLTVVLISIVALGSTRLSGSIVVFITVEVFSSVEVLDAVIVLVSVGVLTPGVGVAGVASTRSIS